MIGLLTERGYIDRWELTDRGTMLLGTFHELDLVLVETMRAGHLDDLDAATLAGVISVFVYESRGRDDRPPAWFPNDSARNAVKGIFECLADVQRLESAYGLPETRDIDAGLVAGTHGWAAGGGLGDILGTEELSGGDFVRSMKQVIDVLSQVATVAQNPTTRSTARHAIDLVRRGIVDAPVDLPENSDDDSVGEEPDVMEPQAIDEATVETEPEAGGRDD